MPKIKVSNVVEYDWNVSWDTTLNRNFRERTQEKLTFEKLPE